MNALPDKPELKVIGVGRVGSYAKAKQGGYSRAHRYWAIARWSNECSEYCLTRKKACGHHQVHYPKGWVEDKNFGKFKTQTEANEHLSKLA